MNATDEKLMKSINDLKNTWYDINEIWNHDTEKYNKILGEKYPFKQCFNELSFNVEEWSDTVEIRLKDESAFKKWCDGKKILTLQEYDEKFGGCDIDVEKEMNVTHVWCWPDGTYCSILPNGNYFAVVDRGDYNVNDIKTIENELWDYVSRENMM